MKVGIFCDCHNTLVNSNEAWTKAFVDHLGQEYTEEIKVCLYGKTKRRVLAEKHNLDINSIERSAHKYLVKNEKLIQILYCLKLEGFHIFVVSNAPKRRVIDDLNIINIMNLFTEIFTEEDGGKINKSIFDNMLEKYNLDVGIFFGNEEFDDHIDHPKITSFALTSFLRERNNILKLFNYERIS